VTAGTVGGGLDPVPVPAVAGDFLAFAIDIGGAQPIGFTQMVPAAASPSVVRVEPGGGGTDVPIDARVRVVFSEPVMRETVINAFGVMQNGNLVEGTVEVSPDGLSATIVPTDYLLPSTAYTISVGSDVQDADGSGMPETVTAAFTTAGLPFTGTLAFAGLTGIQLINADGTNLRQLTTAPDYNYDGDPDWSPDGDRVAFDRYEGYTGGQNIYGIYVINEDGTNLVGLSRPGESDQQPTWSPDGQRIAFLHLDTMPSFASTIYVMNSDGTNRVPVISLRQPSTAPSWSADGRIAFTSYGSTAGPDIFVVNPDGTNLTTLWEDGDDDWRPAWSPDGSRIVFERNGYIFLVNSDGTGLTQLSSTFGSEPAWSPDGRYVIYNTYPSMMMSIISVTDGRSVPAPLPRGRQPSWGP
jgi:TolB protein